MNYKKDYTTTELHHLLALLESTNLIFSLGPKIFKIFPNIEDLFSASTHDLTKIGLQPNEIIKLKKPSWHMVERDLRWAEKTGNYIITINDPSYPQLLKEIPNPPLLLFISGNIQLLKSPQNMLDMFSFILFTIFLNCSILFFGPQVIGK